MTAPLSYPLAQRIPDDQPFVVRHSRLKRGLYIGSALVFVELMMLGLLTLSISEHETSDRVTTAAVLAVAYPIILVGSFLLRTGGGPILAAGPAGLWIRTRPIFGQGVWLPWEAIALISRRRWGIEKVLVVRPHDPRVARLGQYGGYDGRFNRPFYASGFTATLNLADRPEAEILQAVAYYAANRVALT